MAASPTWRVQLILADGRQACPVVVAPDAHEARLRAAGLVAYRAVRVARVVAVRRWVAG